MVPVATPGSKENMPEEKAAEPLKKVKILDKEGG
jgi:hypothetical protein